MTSSATVPGIKPKQPESLTTHPLFKDFGCTVRANIDWFDVVIETPAAHQPNTIETKVLARWPKRQNRDGHIKVSFAQPGESANATRWIRLTFHDPMRLEIEREEIEEFITLDLGAKRLPHLDAIEHGIDLRCHNGTGPRLNKQVMSAWGSFAVELLRCIRPVRGIDVYRVPAARSHNGHEISDPFINSHTGSESALVKGHTVYIGHDPKKLTHKENADEANAAIRLGAVYRQTTVRERTQFRLYKKVMDNGVLWPQDQHLLRIEQTSLGSAMPFDDVLDLLDNDKQKCNAAKSALAACWRAYKLKPGWPGRFQQWRLSQEAKADERTRERARQDPQKRSLLDHALMEDGSCKTDDSAGKRYVRPTAQETWNNRIDSAFARL